MHGLAAHAETGGDLVVGGAVQQKSDDFGLAARQA
jgi:hypothetical protein